MISYGVMRLGYSQGYININGLLERFGLSEVYHPDCIITKYQRKIGWIFWGYISGRYSKGFGVFWEKE